MFNYNRRAFLAAALLLVLVFSLGAWAAPVKYPSALGFVNDFAQVMDQRSAAEIQLVAEKLRKEQGIELAVVTIDSTSPLDPKEYITGLFNTWGVGGQEDSGLVILLAVKEGAIEVEPGYGLEGALPDGKIGAIIDQEGLPYFTNKQYGEGLANLSRAYAAVLAGEEFELKSEKPESEGWLTAFVIFVIIAVLLRRTRRYPPGGSTGGGGGRGPIIIPRSTGRIGGGGISGGFGGGRSGGGGAGRRF
ncbi:MAG: TPM domain-containing protein [Firmicutes bacterium]|nr:TPM domain-containing protein [Bacillota bacterium]